jgi:ABC-2 type transport system permease protein
VIAVRLMLRRHRLVISAWSVLLIALSGATVAFYQSTYSSEARRRAAVEMAQDDAASTLLYGRLPDPGTPAQMFIWEVGAIVTILAALMAVLLAAALTRAAEEDGTLEPLLTCGTDRRIAVRSGYAVLLVVAGVLTLGCTLGVGLWAGRVDAVTWPGALAWGAVVGVTFLVMAVLTVVLAQLATTARAVRTLGVAVVGSAFAVRAVADTNDAVGWLNWLSPLALRTTAAPFTHDRWWVLALYAGSVLGLTWLSLRLFDRREYGAGLLRGRPANQARLHVRSSIGLDAWLGRQSLVTWTVAVACLGTLFAAMGSAPVEQSRQGDLDGFLGAQLDSPDPIAAYFSYSGTVVGLAVAVFAVLSVLRQAHAEHDGLTDHVLATGARRWEPLAAGTAVTAVGSAIILLATGTVSALIAPTAIAGTDVALRAFTYSIGQWPAAVAAAGWTALLVGLRPRTAWWAWLPLAASGILALLGQLLGVPSSVQQLGIFQHVPDPASTDSDLRGLAVLLACAAATTVAGLAATTRRDITIG